MWNRNVSWTDANLYRQFTPGTTTGAWHADRDQRPGPHDPRVGEVLAGQRDGLHLGQRGVLYDPTHRYLWAVGQGKLVPYSITGTYRNTRLTAQHGSINLGTYTNSAGVVTPNLGHDLQPSYTDSDTLFVTHTTGVYSVNTSTFALIRISGTTRVKAYVNQAGGERAWVRGDNTGSRTWGSPTVQFFDPAGVATETRTRSGAEFYKVRNWTTAFE